MIVSLRSLYRPFVKQNRPMFVVDITCLHALTCVTLSVAKTKISHTNIVSTLTHQYCCNLSFIKRKHTNTHTCIPNEINEEKKVEHDK